MPNEINPNVGFDLTALDVLLDSIASDATQVGLSRKAFYSSLHRKIVAGTESLASAVWVANPSGQVRSANNMADNTGWASLSEGGKKEVQQLVRGCLQPDSGPVA